MLRLLCTRIAFARALLIALTAVAVGAPAQAADKTYSGATSANWTTTLLGATAWTNGTDGAIFAGVGVGISPVAGAINAESINFTSNGWTLSQGTSDTITLVNTGSSSLSAGNINVTTGYATINAPIAGTLGLTKVGAGTLILGAANTYTTGATAISTGGGILQLGANGTLPSGTNLTIDDSALTTSTFTTGLNLGAFNQTIGTLTIAMPLTTSAATAITGTGTLTLGGNVTTTGSSGAYPVVIAAPVNLGTATRTFAPNNGNNTFYKGDLQFTGVISGTGGVTINSASGGGVAFGAANNYTGATTLTSGYLYTLVSNAIPATSAFSQSAGTLDLTAGGSYTNLSTTLGSLTGTGGVITLGAMSILSIGGDNTSPAAYAGAIGGTGGALTKIGTGTLTLSGANTYTGATTINSGTLLLSATGTALAISASSPLVLAGGTLSDNGASTSSQSFASITINSGGSTVAMTTGAGHVLAMGALATPAIGATVNFKPLSSTSGAVGSISTSKLNTNGILGGWATFNGTNWAMSGGPTAGNYPIAAFPTASGTNANTTNMVNSATNFNITGTLSPTTISAANSIDFTAAGTLTIPSASTLTLTSGGVLIPSTTGVAAIATGTIKGSSGGSLYIEQFTTSAFSISSVIANNSSATALTYTGASASAMTLSGVNLYSGTTTINGGTLTVGVVGAIPANGNVVINTGATFNTNSALENSTSIGNVTINGGSMVAPGAGTSDFYMASLTMTGGIASITSTGDFYYRLTTSTGVTINSSTSTATWTGNGTAGGSMYNQFGSAIPINVVGGATNGIDLDDSMEMLGAYTKTGAGVMRLSNTSNGATITVSAGKLRVDTIATGTTGAFGSGTTTINGGTVTYGGTASTSTTASFALGTSTSNAIEVINAGITLTQTTAITGTGGGFTKIGAGTLNLGVANSYTGATAVSAGILTLGVSTALATSASPLVIGAASSATTDTTGELTLAAGITQTISGLTIYQGYGTRLDVTTGTLTLTGALNYSNITGGGGTAGSAGPAILAGTGGGKISLTTLTAFNNSAQGNTADVTISAIIAGTSPGGINYTGTANAALPATLLLTAANTYTGATTINQGILRIGIVNALPTATALTLSNAISSGTAAQNAVLDLNGFNQQVTSLATGTSAVSAQNIVTNSSATAATLTVSGTTSTTYAGLITGALGLTKGSTGTLTLSGANSYAGTTTITGGIIALGASGSLPSGTNLSISEGALTSATLTNGLNLSTFNQTVGTLTVAMSTATTGGTSGTTAISGTGTLTLGGTLTVNGATGDYGVKIAAPASLGSATRIFTAFGTSGTSSNAGARLGDLQFTSTAVISGTGSAGVTITGASSSSIVNFGAANTYPGATTLMQGILYATVTNAIPAASSFVQSAGTTLDLTTGGTVTAGISTGLGSLTGAGSIILGSSSTLTVGGDGTSPAAYTGIISGTGGSLTQTSNGILTLGGANTYSGSTTLNPGTTAGGGITFSGSGTSLSAGALNVGNGGAYVPTLTFENTTAGNINNRYATTAAVTLNSGAITLNGNSAGTAQSLGALTVSGSGTSTITVNSTAGFTSSLTFASLSIGASATLIFAGNNFATSGDGVSSQIFFTTPPTLTGGYINNAYIGTVSGTTRATYSASNGVILFALITGNLIDNIASSDAYASNTLPVATNASFQTTGNYVGTYSGTTARANTGAKITALTLDAADLTLFGGYTGQAGNGNTANGTLAITSGIISQTGPHTIYADSSLVSTLGTGTIALGNGATITTSTALTFDSSITVTGNGVTKNGSDVLTFNGPNSITGPFAVTAGTLVSGTASIGSFTQSGTALASTFSGPLTASGAVSVGIGTLSIGTLSTDNATVGSFTQNGTATSTTLTGSLISTGTVAVSSGTLAAVNASMTTFTQSGAATSTTLSGTLTASGAVSMSAGSLNVAAASVGSFTQSGSSTATSVAGAFIDAGSITLTAGTLTLGGTSSATSLTGSGTLALGTTGALTVTQTTGTTFGGTITGSTGSFTLAGSGTLALSGNNSGFTGTTYVTGGVLSLSADTNLGSVLSVSNGATLAFGAAYTLTSAHTITFDTGGGFIDPGTFSTSQISAPIGGSGAITKINSGTLTLTGASTTSGTFTINPGTTGGGVTFSGTGTALSAGALTVGNGTSVIPTLTFDNTATNTPNRYSTAATVTLNNGAITLIGNTAGTAQTLGALTVSGTGTSTVTVNSTTAASSLTFNSLSIGGSSTLVFAGNNLNTTGTGLSQIFFSTAPTLNAYGYIANAYIGAVSAVTYATYNATNGVILYAPAGNLIDNIATSDPNSTNNFLPVPTTVKFTITGTYPGNTIASARANTGATIATLVIDGADLTLFGGYSAQSGNGNVASGTLAITNQLTSQNLNHTIYADSTLGTGTVALGSGATITTTTNLTLDTTVTLSAAAFTKNGSGTLTLNGGFTTTGLVTVSAGSLSAAAATLGSFTQNGGSSSSFSGTLSAGAVTVSTGTFSAAGPLLASYTQNGTATSSSFSGTLGVSGALSVSVGSISGASASVGTYTQSGTGSTNFTGTLNSTGTISISAGSFTFSGSGTSTISALTQTGGTTSFGGTLNVGAVSVSAGTFSGANVSAASYTQNGTATSSTITGAFTDAGAITLSTGTLTLGGTGSAASLATSSGTTLALGTTGALTVTQTTSTTLAGLITGTTGSLTKAGSGTLTISGSNTGFTGTLGANGGIVATTADANLGGTTSTVAFNGGTLQFGATYTIPSTGQSITVGTNGGTIDTSTFAPIIAAPISGGGTLTKISTGTLTLSGNNSYGGGTTVSAGTLNVSSTTALGAGGLTMSTTLAVASTVNINSNSTITSLTATTIGSAIPSLVIASAITLTDTQTTSTAFNGAISGAGSFTLNGAGGTLALGGANSFSAGTTVSAGTLNVNSTTGLGTAGLTMNTTGTTASTVNINASSTITSLATTTTGTAIPSLVIASGITLTNSQTTSTTFNGVISGAGSFTTSGSAGVLTLNQSPTYSGTTSITGGSAITLGTNITLPTGTNLTLGTANGTDNILTIAGGVLTVGTITAYNGSSLTPVNITGTGSLTITGNITQPATGVSYSTVFGASVPITLTSTAPVITGGYNENDTLTYGDMDFLGSIAGSHGITFTTIAPGTSGSTPAIVLSGNNTFTGGVTIAGATLRINNLGALNSATPNGVTMTATSTETSVLRLQGNSITISSLASSGAGTIYIEGYATSTNAVLTVNQSINTTFNGIMEDDTASTALLALTKTGSGTLTLTGANTYTGGTAINGGILNAGGTETAGTSGPFGASGTITFGGGTLQYSASNTFDYSSRFSTTATGEPYSVDTNGQTVTWATALGSSGGSLTKIGTGTLNLTAASPNLTGGTTITGGILNLGISSALTATGSSLIIGASSSSSSNTSGELTLGATFTQTLTGLTIYQGSGTRVSLGATGTLTLSGAFNYLNIAGGGGTLGNAAGTMTITSSGATISLGTALRTFTVNGQNNASGTPDVTISAVLTGTSAGGINYIGVPSTFASTVPAILKLSKANTYAGATTINEGILQMGIAGALPSASALTLANNISSGTAAQNAVLDLNGFNQTVTSLASGSGAVTAQNIVTNTSGTAATLTVSGATSTTYAGLITGSLGLTKGLSGTLTLGGADTYTGATTLSGGSIFTAVNNAIPSNSAFVQTTGTTLDLTAGATLTNISTGVGSLTGGGSIKLGGTSTLTVGGDGTTPAAAYTGVISGPGGSLTKTGAGTLKLGGANTYSGATTLSQGSIYTTANSAIPSTSAFVQTAGTTLDLTAGGALTNISTGVGSLTGAGSIILGASSTLTVGGDNTSPAAYTGVISVYNGTGGALTKTGSGILWLSGANTYTGTTTINAGTLWLGSSGAAGTGTIAVVGTAAGSTLLTNAAVAIANPITVAAPGSGFNTIGGNGDYASSFAGAITLSGDLTVAQATTSGTNALTISGGISAASTISATVTLAGPGKIIVSNPISDGSGTVALMISGADVTLAAANNFSGAITLKTGVLRFNSTTPGSGTGNVIVNGGVLRGNGVVGGPVTVNLNGTILAGNSPDTLTLNRGLTVASGGTFGLEIADGSTPSSTPGGSTSFSPQTNNFYHIVSGGASILSGALINVQIDAGTTFLPGSTYSYWVADGTGDQTGLNFNNTITTQITFSGLSNIDTSTATLTGDDMNLGNGVGNIYLSFTTMVPEPAALLGLAALVLGFPALRRGIHKA